jgi:hypothetical protein
VPRLAFSMKLHKDKGARACGAVAQKPMGGRLELVGGSPAGTYLGRVARSGFLLARVRWSAWGTEALPEWAWPIKTRRPALLQFAALLQ